MFVFKSIYICAKIDKIITYSTVKNKNTNAVFFFFFLKEIYAIINKISIGLLLLIMLTIALEQD